jgi:hypothetical protein
MIFNQAKHTRTKLLSESQGRAVACAGIEPRVALGTFFVALVAFFVSHGARADGVGGQTNRVPVIVQSAYGVTVVATKPSNPAVPPAWTNKSQYADCGQDCLYQKGNENISLQALYTVNKLNNIHDIIGEVLNQQDYDAVMGEMHPYCPDVTYTPGSLPTTADDDADKCFQRYLQVQVPLLRKMKAAIVHNDDAAGQLQTNQRLIVQNGLSNNEKKVSVFGRPQSSVAKKPQTPEFETEDELLSTPEGQKKLQVLASESYARWATNQMQAVAPKKEDYVMTVPVHRDPKDPSSEMIDRIVRNSDGTPKINEKEYQAALAEYNSQLQPTHLANDESIPELVKTYAKDPKMTLGSLDPVIGAQGRVPKGKGLEYRLDEVSYEQARNQAVQATNDLLRKEGVLASGAGSGAKKSGILAPGASAADANKKNAAQTAASQYGAQNVLVDPKGPGIVKGNLVQPSARPNSAMDGDYTVSYKPEEMNQTAEDYQGYLLKLDNRVATEVGGAPAPGPTSAPTPVAGQGNHGGSGGAGSGSGGVGAAGSNVGPAPASVSGPDGGLTMPAHPDGSMQEQGSFENPTSAAAPHSPVQQPDSN